MDRRRAAGLLLALAACIATATAAPTASNHTALDLYDDAPEGCYYNFQHYGEGDRIMTNEPCLNCTCHNRMLMCYLRVCPFTKPIGQDCTIEKRADQCCPIVTCPDVPVDLLTSTTTSPAEYGPTGIGKLEKFGCSINGKYFSEGSKVPPTPNKPCEHCYCIRNMTTCVMQECTLHVDGCTPIYHKDVCCPVRYSCDHPEDEMPLLDDLSTTVRPTPGFLLTTTTISPVTQMSQDCIYDNRVFPDGALIKTEKACDHCYCMKGDIVCVVQECGTPMENEGKNCTAVSPREGVCCPDTYICEGDESTTGTYETYDFTTHAVPEEVTTLSPPRRTSSEGSGYRNEPDEITYTESPSFEPEIEGSGEEEEPQQPTEFKPASAAVPGSTDDILASTEETHEYIPLETTTKPIENDRTTSKVSKEDENMISSSDEQISSESHQSLTSTTSAYSEKETEVPITEKTQEQDMGSGEIPSTDESLKPHDEHLIPGLPVTEKSVTTTEINKQDITLGITERDSSESQMPTTSIPIAEEDKTKEPTEQASVTGVLGEKTTSNLPTEHVATTPTLEESSETAKSTEISPIYEETASKGPELETYEIETTSIPTIENEGKGTTDSANQDQITSVPNEFNREDNIQPQTYKTSTSVPDVDDEFVTTESQEHESATENVRGTEFLVPHQHVTASTPLLEEIEKDTTAYTEPENIVPSDATQGDTSYIMSSTIAYVDNDKKDVTESTIPEENITEDFILGTSNIPAYDQQEITTVESHKIPEIQTSQPTEADVKESLEPENYSPPTSTPASDKNGRRTTPSDLAITTSEDDGKPHDFATTTTTSDLERESATTEPDKGLNTIPSDSIEDGLVSSEDHKTTMAGEKITTESDLSDTKFNSDADSITTPSKQTTISSDTSVSRDESSTLTTESAFRKEDYSPTESQTMPELTTVAADVTNEVISTLTHDHTKSTESILDVQQEIHTTSEPKYTENIEESTLVKESTDRPSYESSTSAVSVSEKDFNAEEETTTNIPLHEKLPETTANQEDNEILNEPRIPGEGDCLLNGVTYTNESVVPSTNKCQSGCKCISSIIKCDPIICSPPPEYMDHCETMYDTPEACCPTYICDHKTETIPPQSHSQMSGTEAPVASHVHCHGDECEISEDKKQPEEPSDACKSGRCESSTDESQYTTSSGPAPVESIPEQPTKDQKEKCLGDKCTPILCTAENGCLASPVPPCEGENCVKIPEVILLQEPCADGEDCTILKEPSKECSAGNCGADTQLEDTYPKETCTDKEGCQNIPNISEKECTEENCEKKDITALDQKLPEQCTEPDCKHTQKDMDSSTPSVLETSPQENKHEDGNKETDVTVMEMTEKTISPTEPSQHIPSHETSELTEAHEMVTEKQPGVPDYSLTTLSDQTEVVTKSESESETTNKPTDFTHQQEVTSSEYVPDKTKLDSTEEPGYLIPVSTETKLSDNEASSPSLDETATDIPDASVTSDYAVYTEEQQTATERVTTKLFEHSSTEPSKTYTLEIHEVAETSETLKPEDVTMGILEEASTEPSKTESQEVTKPLDEIEYDHTTKGIKEESSIEPHGTDDMKSEKVSSKIPEILDHAVTTPITVEESSTEPSKTYSTESQDITDSPVEIRPEEVSEEYTEENITKPPKSSDNTKYDDFTKEISEENVTEPTKPIETEEQTGDVDHLETPSKTTSDYELQMGTTVLPVDTQKVTKTTGDIDQDSTTTMKTVDDISSVEPTTFSIESQDTTESPKEKEHEDTTLNVTEETETEPTKTYITESLDITKTSEQLDHEVTSIKVLVEPSTESSIPHSTEHQNTKSPQDLHDEDAPTKISDETSTLPPKTHTESDEVSKSSEDTEHKDIIIASEGTSTEASQPYVTEVKSPGEEYHDATTSKITEESSSEIPKTTMAEQEITKSSEKIEDQDTTTNISEATYPITTKPQEVPKYTEDGDQKDTTSKISEETSTEPPKMHSTELQDVTKAPEDSNERTTVYLLEESSTRLPIPVSSEIVDQEDLTSKIPESPVTEPTTSEAQYLSTTSENVELISTTMKARDESATEQSKIPVENEILPESPVTESDEKENIKPSIVEMLTESPKKDEENLSTETETAEMMTTAQELFTPELVELTTTSSIPDSQKTTADIVKHEDTTSEAISDLGTQPTQANLDDITESVKEQISSTPVPIDHDIVITSIPVTNDSEKTHIQPTLETQTTLSPTDEVEKVTKPDLYELPSTQKPDYLTDSEKEVTVQTATEKGSAIIITDELRTTSPEIQEITTLKPAAATQAPHDVEIKPDYPEVSDNPQEEQQTTTEEILAGTKQPAEVDVAIQTEKPAEVDVAIQTEKPITAAETDLMKGTEPEKETPETSSEGKPLNQEEGYTDEPTSKYSSPAPTIEYDSTKSSAEDISTVEPMVQESSKPEKPIDGLSLVTEQHAISTTPSNLETDSQTQIPVHLSSATPESDITATSEQDIIKEKLTTPSISTSSEFDNKSDFVTSTEYVSTVQEEIRTESPSSEDKTGDEITTQKEHSPKESQTSVQPSVPEQSETTTTSEHKFTTERPDMIPVIEVTAKTVPSDTTYTEIQEPVTTDQSLVEMPTQSSYTTETSEIKYTSVEDQSPPVSDHEFTEPEQEATKSPDVQTQEQTEPLAVMPASGTEAPMLEPVESTEFSSSDVQTTTLKQEYSTSTRSPSVEYTDKDSMEENATSSSGEHFTTESARVTEMSTASISPEVHTEKLPENIQTVTPEKAIPIEEFLTTRKQYEPGVYQTTLAAIENIPEISTRSPVSEEAIEHTSPNEEQTIPVDISAMEKISTPEESVQAQTESATQPSERPLQGITAPEEEFILATSKVTTKVEEEIPISSLSPIVDSSTKPVDAESLVTIVPEAPATISLETPVTTEAEISVTRTPEVSVTTVPEVSVTTVPEVSVTTGPEVSVTTVPEEPVRPAFETTLTTEAEMPVTITPEPAFTTSPESPVTTAPESSVTTAPEAPITKLPEAADTTTSEESVTTTAKAPVTLAQEIPITKLPEAPITTAHEAPVTTASEVPFTSASEAPATAAPEAPITSAPELPKPVSTDMQPTDEVSTHDGEPSFPPSSETSGYGQEPDYGDEDQTFGPGTCRYGGKVYVSAQQIPRDDPCDFCFCFRSDIICLQQSCPPPIHGCHEEPIQGFCCPRYECPVSMATSVNVTTTTTTTTTTLPPHFPTHSYKGSVQKRGCQIKGQTYKVGDVVRASSGPCLHCTCGGDGQMKCDPKACTPEPMLRQMIAAAVSAKRRR